MSILDVNKNKQKTAPRNGLKSIPAPKKAPATHPSFRSRNLPNDQPQIISGYFIEDKSYKEMAISRVNTSLCLLLAFLVSICLVSYYFVIRSEIQLNKIQKETLALNYDNEEMQNKLDNLQSYYNVDKTVSKTNILGRAKQIMELPAANIPSVRYDDKEIKRNPSWSMGY